MLVPAGDLFGMITRTFDLPASWAALVTTEAGTQRVVPAGGVIEAIADLEDVLLFRTTPMQLEFSIVDVAAADGFRCSVAVTIHACSISERSEIASFRRSVLGSRRLVRTADMNTFLAPTVRRAVLTAVETHDALALVEGNHDEALAAALADSLRETFFSSGLSLDRAPAIRVESDAARRLQVAREETARSRAEHEAGREMRAALEAAQREHVDHLATMLSRLNELAEASPEVALPELLQSFSEKQRGELYGALFAADQSTSVTQWIVVAAGDELLFYDPADLDAPQRRLTVSGEAGPVRCIETDATAANRPVLLLGAATGIYHLPLDRTEPDETFRVAGDLAVRGGFNAAVVAGDCLFGTHSELGLRVWPLDKPDEDRVLFASLTEGAAAVRGVCAYGDELFCSIDDRVVRWRGSEAVEPERTYVGSAATITALQVTPDGIFAGNSQGEVVFWSHGRPDEPEVLHRGLKRPVESLWPLASGGVKRLVYTDLTHKVHARVVGDSFTCAYEAGGQTLRRAEVAPDLIAATTEVRDRVICWSPGEPARPRGTIPASRLTGRSVQDVCLVPFASKNA